MDAPNPPTPEPTIEPGERRLSRPPSDRYGMPDAAAATTEAANEATGSPARGITLAVVVAIGVAFAITVLGGILLISAGLVVVAAAGGWAVATALRLGSGHTVPPSTRRWLAVGIAVAAVVLGQIGLWLFARTEGGVLPIFDYLAQTFGPVVPLQLVVAPLAAAWSSR